MESEYDRYGGRTKVRSSLGADISLGYDSFGLVSSIDARGNHAEDTPAWQSDIRRDEAGREVERFATGGIRVTTDYDDMGWFVPGMFTRTDDIQASAAIGGTRRTVYGVCAVICCRNR